MKSILIVDDDQAVLEMLGLRLIGKYLTFTTTNPSLAVSMAQAKRPDLVLCDLDMPTMNGANVAAALRKEFPRLPVVFLTGLVTPQEAKAGAIKGERVIAKSAPIAELLHCIQSIIGP